MRRDIYWVALAAALAATPMAVRAENNAAPSAAAAPSVVSPVDEAAVENVASPIEAPRPTPPVENAVALPEVSPPLLPVATTPSAPPEPPSAPVTAVRETLPVPAPVTANSSIELEIAAALRDRLAAIRPSIAPRERADHEAVTQFYAARDHKPLWHGADGRPLGRENSLRSALREAGTWGLHEKDFAEEGREQLFDPAMAKPVAEADLSLTLAALRYARHARGGRIDPSSLTAYLDRKPQLEDPAKVLGALMTADAPGAYLESLHPQHPEFLRLRQAYLAARNATPRVEEATARPATRRGAAKAAKASEAATARRILANMEQWRWMPSDLGDFHVWINVPEFQVRVMQDAAPVHTERVIVGKVTNQTPIFSHEIQQVIFHPFWGVPDSIKRNEILPALARSPGILARHNLKISLGGRDVDPAKVDWRSVDIRRFHVYQPPGGGNVLGVVKFRFENKHQVYLHDTPTKGLFQTAVRTYSHGCVRVQSPVKLAALLLARDRNMSEARVASLGAAGAPRNNTLGLTQKVPIHITYFTVRVEPDGTVRALPDVYGHEQRIALALEGKAHLVARTPRPTPAAPIASLAERQTGGSGGSRPDWARQAFGMQH